MRICFASHNKNKVKEIDEIAPVGIEVYGLEALGFHEEIEETGETMEENSRIKATHIFSRFNIPVFADDSGLEVHALNGDPGVYSARYAGEPRDSQNNIDLLLKNLTGSVDMSAQFKSVITFINSDGKEMQFTGVVRGQITHNQVGTNGFGYDPVFIPEGFDQTFAQMESSLKNKLSHRAKAFDQLLSYLKQLDV